MYIILIIVLLFIAFIGLFLYFSKGREGKIDAKSQNDLPNGITSLDAGFLLKGYVSSKDVLSLLLYLSSKGYIMLDDLEDEQELSSSASFKIVKLKDYDDDNSYERKFMDKLFISSNTVSMLNLSDYFYNKVDEIKRDATLEYSKKIVDNDIRKYKILYVILFFLTYLFITVHLFATNFNYDFLYNDIAFYIPFELMVYIFIFLLLKGGLYSLKNVSTKKSLKAIIFAIIAYIILGNVITTFLLIRLKEYGYVTVTFTYLFGKIVMLILLICYMIFYKRNDYGIDMYKRVVGYKNYLTNNTINDFYDKISYFYVLGVDYSKYKDVSNPEYIKTNKKGTDFIKKSMNEFEKKIDEEIYNSYVRK